ncbi:MAG: hypothetical protein ACYC7A_12220 [Thermoanaerobaculia bacterium]
MAIDKHDPSRPKEPQSYGSEKDWQTGRTDQSLDETLPENSDPAFYEPRHHRNDSPGDTGGTRSPLRAGDDSDPPSGGGEVIPEPQQPKRFSELIDARKSFFKDRDYGGDD